MSDNQTRVRFAPSPTGYLHIGGARTALFNWLYARHTGGTIVLRIEDTDLERSTEESIGQILDALEWLGIDYDEGPISQAGRIEWHHQKIAEMEASGAVYRSYLTAEEQQAKREEVIAAKKAFTFKRRLYDLPEEEANRRAQAGAPYVLRMNIGEEGSIAWEDAIRGATSFNKIDVEDFVVARTDGTPTFNFVCAADDGDMRMTHVIRGEDHISNTPKQIAVLQALNYEVPVYAHVSLILGTDRARLSKRHGATSVQQFRDEGYLPEALVNFLALLGWSFDDATEIFSPEELVKHFTLERVNKSAAIFDQDKLNYLNGYYLRNQPKEQTLKQARERLAEAGLLDASIYKERGDQWLMGIIDLEIERSKLLEDFVVNLRYFFERPADYEEKGVKKLFAKDKAAAADILSGVRECIADESVAFTSEGLDTSLRALAEARELGFGKIAQPVRLALTGRTASPGLYDVMVNLGRDECLARLDGAIAYIATLE